VCLRLAAEQRDVPTAIQRTPRRIEWMAPPIDLDGPPPAEAMNSIVPVVPSAPSTGAGSGSPPVESGVGTVDSGSREASAQGPDARRVAYLFPLITRSAETVLTLACIG
jgi:hypothetical protein